MTICAVRAGLPVMVSQSTVRLTQSGIWVGGMEERCPRVFSSGVLLMRVCLKYNLHHTNLPIILRWISAIRMPPPCCAAVMKEVPNFPGHALHPSVGFFFVFYCPSGKCLTAPSKAVKKGRHEMWPGSGSRCVGGQMRTMYNGILSNKWEGRKNLET